MSNILGNYIAQFRKKKNITQQELANLIGMERTSLSQIETGAYNPSAESMKKISDALNEPLGMIFFNPSVLNSKTKCLQDIK